MRDFDKQMEMVLYHSDEGDVSVDAYIKDESIWITQKSMAALFDVNVPDISKHLTNIYDEGELIKEATVSKLEIVQYDIANLSDIPELIRLRILYMIDDFGSISDKEKESMEDQLPGFFERELGKKLIAFVARAEGRLVAAAYLLIIEKPANPFLPNGYDSEVFSVYTEEKYRGRGICTKLMSNMIEYAKEHHICRIDLMATDEGYPIYKKLGFEDKVQKYTDMRLNLL